MVFCLWGSVFGVCRLREMIDTNRMGRLGFGIWVHPILLFTGVVRDAASCCFSSL